MSTDNLHSWRFLRAHTNNVVRLTVMLALTVSMMLSTSAGSTSYDQSMTARNDPPARASGRTRDRNSGRRRRYGRDYRRKRNPVTRAVAASYRTKKAAVVSVGRGARRVVTGRSRNRAQP
ncbi:MAG: hypothetical protein H0V27_10670 [Pyrinomonadaceae bacterium]|nr:hypothetical protein [Pyrinomonadaceae bacterium]